MSDYFLISTGYSGRRINKCCRWWRGGGPSSCRWPGRTPWPGTPPSTCPERIIDQGNTRTDGGTHKVICCCCLVLNNDYEGDCGMLERVGFRDAPASLNPKRAMVCPENVFHGYRGNTNKKLTLNFLIQLVIAVKAISYFTIYR